MIGGGTRAPAACGVRFPPLSESDRVPNCLGIGKEPLKERQCGITALLFDDERKTVMDLIPQPMPLGRMALREFADLRRVTPEGLKQGDSVVSPVDARVVSHICVRRAKLHGVQPQVK